MSRVDVLSSFPDNDEPKAVCLQADGLAFGPRHVSLRWSNDLANMRATQIIHLTGIPGRYEFRNIAKLRRDDVALRNQFFDLGVYTRIQRDRIILLAQQIKFNPTSTVNTCRPWMRDLLWAMVNDPVIRLPRAKFDMIDKSVPLFERLPEA